MTAQRIKTIAGLLAILVLLVIGYFQYAKLSHKLDRVADGDHRVALKVAYAPFTANLPFFVAAKEKYFLQRGLDVSPVEYRIGTEMLQSLTSHETDLAAPIPLADILNAHARDSNVLRLVWVALEKDGGQPVSAFIASTNSGIENLDDLANKKVGAFAKSAVGAVKLMLEKRGITNATVIESNPNSVLVELELGRIDAAFVIEPLFSVAKTKGFARIIQVNPRAKILHDPYIVGGLALPVQVLKDKARTESAHNFLDALVDGAKWIELHPEQARVLLSQYVRYTPQELEHSGSYTWTCLSDKMVKELRITVDLLKKTGVVSDQVELDKLIENRLFCDDDSK